jgi:hypothetical protein
MRTKSALQADLGAEIAKPWPKTESEWRDLASAVSLTIGSLLACAVERRRFPVGEGDPAAEDVIDGLSEIVARCQAAIMLTTV